MINEIVAAAEHYMEAGFALVPLPAGEKGPRNRGWNLIENCIRTSAGVRDLQYGVGLAHAYCSEPTCSLDVDDLLLASAWLKERGVDLNTLLDAEDAVQIKSGRPGKAKLLYKLPEGIPPLPSKALHLNGRVALEFRCATAEGKTVQDVLPPSVHPETGLPYAWSGRGDFRALPVLPEELLNLWNGLLSGMAVQNVSQISNDGSQLAEPNGNAGFPETPENIARVSNALGRVSADCAYPAWAEILFALKSTGWNCAEALARSWSKTAPSRWELPEPRFQKTWGSAKRDGGITIASLFYRAKLESLSERLPQEVDEVEVQDIQSQSIFEMTDGRMHIPTLQPAPRDYLFAESVVRGTLAILGGLGGTAKTTGAMQICAHGAIGRDLGNLQVSAFSSMMFLGEEVQAERDRRFGAICKDLSDAARKQVQERVLCFPSAGKDLRVTWLSGKNPVNSGLSKKIVELARQHEFECGLPVGLIVLDHARLVMAGDPNAAQDVSQLTRVLVEVAIATNSAVLLLAHSPKSVHTKETEIDASEIAGSSAFVDNARCAFVLHTMRPAEAKEYDVVETDRKDYVCLTTAKSNYGPTGAKWWFKKESVPGWQTVRLVPITLYAKSLFPNVNALSVRITDIVKQARGRITARNLRDKAGLDGVLKASEAVVMRTVERLIDEGELVKRSPTPEERRLHRLSPNVREVLDVA